METVKPCSPSLGDCNRDIDRLLEAFGSAFSLEAITSAYSQARRNVDLAGVILYELQGETSMASGSQDEHDASSLLPPELSSEDASQCPSTADGNLTSLVQGKIVSGVPGGEYVRPTLSTNGSSRSQLSKVSSTEKDSDSMPGDVEEFLFKMLGDGFQLDMKVVHEVIGLCGYDLEKSMETLVDISASSLEKSDDVISMAAENSQEYLKNGTYLCPEKSKLPDSSLRSVNQNGKESRKKNKDKYGLEKEILRALFIGPERVEGQPKQVRRSSAFGRPVIEPLRETKIEQTFVAVKPLGVVKEDEEGENSFKVLRQAVREYWAMMKEYYKAAVDAYKNGDQVRAYKLMKEGQFYNSKAREADVKSGQKLLETSDQEMLFDLGTFEPKQAVKFLRLRLSNLAGIPSFPLLKANMGNDDGESKRKRLVVKFLENESIKWTEEDNGKTIVIRMDEINPKTLSFTGK